MTTNYDLRCIAVAMFWFTLVAPVMSEAVMAGVF